jgi:hypothetical protein
MAFNDFFGHYNYCIHNDFYILLEVSTELQHIQGNEGIYSNFKKLTTSLSQIKMKFELPKPLCLLISSELFATLIVSALFVYSNNRSENATCLDNGFGDGGTIRRYHGFRLPEG